MRQRLHCNEFLVIPNCPETKIVPSWFVGKRTAEYANKLMSDLRCRVNHRVQLTTDGYKSYPEAVENAFGDEVDFATLVKNFGKKPGQDGQQVIGAEEIITLGEPDPKHISTSLVERQNLTLRMGMKRFQRKTAGFSKDIEYLKCSIAIHFMHYNFIRRHQSLKTTPAVRAGIVKESWTFEDVLDLL